MEAGRHAGGESAADAGASHASSAARAGHDAPRHAHGMAREKAHGHAAHGKARGHAARGGSLATHPAPRFGMTAARVVAPERLIEKGYEKEAVVYAAAAGYPAVVDGVYCYRHGQDRNQHYSLLTCFESGHGAFLLHLHGLGRAGREDGGRREVAAGDPRRGGPALRAAPPSGAMAPPR